MNKTHIIGREEECKRLDDCLQREQAQLIMVYGRRRVGKTYLINEYFEGTFAFKLTGIYNQSTKMQLFNFAEELKRCKYNCETPDNWIEAFSMLRTYLETLPQDTKQIVFFDEMPWMDTPRSGFLSAFEWFWNSWGNSRHNLVFVICGSATSWMVKNIDDNKGGLYNRTTCKLFLKPFNLKETEEFLINLGINWSRYTICQCYMIMGGIPYYLSLLRPNLSFDANIDNLFFKDKSELFDEFDSLYNTSFTNSSAHIKVVETLSKKRGGYTRQQLSQLSGLPGNGELTKILNNLEYSGFIRVLRTYGKKSKDKVYQLSDYYTAFYFKFLKDNYGKDENYWSNTIDNPTRNAWSGLTFEQVCLDHINQIKRKLGISGVLSEYSTWQKTKDEEGEGAQIDLLIDRRDQVINVCEMKFSTSEYEIDKTYDMKLRNKINSFVKATNTKKALHPTMITTYGVKKNMYGNNINFEVVLDDLFVE